ncbi:MAG: hypothetical protein P4L99_03060 [Chthoniobacter sp.]|nr:hypothetical protein [Chthoniobacter sp.]
MWNPFRTKKADVISHWYTLVPGFHTSTQDFYAAIEKALVDMEVPGLEMGRVEFSEGGPLSAKREYLRMSRERLVFDVCAAPFGTSYFFSMRFAELPSVLRIWSLLIVFFGGCFLWFLFWKIFGFFFGSFLLLVGIAALIYVVRNPVTLGLKDLDATLIKMPILGAVYEGFFRKEAYYRQDTRLMYLETVNMIVKAQAEEVTAAKGIKLLSIKQHAPLLDDLYKPTLLHVAPTSEVSHDAPGLGVGPGLGVTLTLIRAIPSQLAPSLAGRFGARPFATRPVFWEVHGYGT